MPKKCLTIQLGSSRLRGGSTFTKILMTYSKVTQPNHIKDIESVGMRSSHLVDLENNTFNLPTLYRFFQELAREETFVPSPAQIIPTCTESFLSYLQTFGDSDIDLKWVMEVEALSHPPTLPRPHTHTRTPSIS